MTFAPLRSEEGNILYINHVSITAVLGEYLRICDANMYSVFCLLGLFKDILIAVLGWLLTVGLVSVNSLLLCFKWHSKTGQE